MEDETKQGQKGLSILEGVYEKVITGVPPISEPLEQFAQEYIKQTNGDREKAVDKMISNQIGKLATTGFLTGLGGLITLPVTIPADITTGLYVQMRMIGAIAYMRGYDLKSDAVKTLVYTSLVGIKVMDLAKQVGIRASEKVAMNMLKKLPGKVIVKINQKVGFRFLTKFGQKGLINLVKIIPVVPGVINATWNSVETKAIAERAKKEFN